MSQKKTIGKQTGTAWNFSQPPMQVHRGAYIFYFNPQVRISKMLTKDNLDYHPSPSELSSRIHCIIFLWISKGFISPSRTFLELFIKPVYPTKVAEKFQNHYWVWNFCESKIESIHSYSCPQAKLFLRFSSSALQAEEITHF